MVIGAMSHQFQASRLKAAGQMVTEAVAVKRRKQKMTMLLTDGAFVPKPARNYGPS